MKKNDGAFSRFVDQAYPFVTLFCIGYAGYTLNQYGETGATIGLAIAGFLCMLEHHAFTSQTEELNTAKRNLFILERKHFHAKKREEVSRNIMSEEQSYNFTKLIVTYGLDDYGTYDYDYFDPYSESGMYESRDYSFLK